MVTVEADPVRVESRLVLGGIRCPTCGDGVLGGCGYARVRQIEGLIDDSLDPSMVSGQNDRINGSSNCGPLTWRNTHRRER